MYMTRARGTHEWLVSCDSHTLNHSCAESTLGHHELSLPEKLPSVSRSERIRIPNVKHNVTRVSGAGAEAVS